MTEGAAVVDAIVRDSTCLQIAARVGHLDRLEVEGHMTTVNQLEEVRIVVDWALEDVMDQPMKAEDHMMAMGQLEEVHIVVGWAWEAYFEWEALEVRCNADFECIEHDEYHSRKNVLESVLEEIVGEVAVAHWIVQHNFRVENDMHLDFVGDVGEMATAALVALNYYSRQMRHHSPHAAAEAVVALDSVAEMVAMEAFQTHA
mmetsp:Transcript_10326/g.38330  ORF Transcript_10326/g.38330 Transcript_10326/m.38330 type:complete len:202 (-) Transcript_10326:161-766(-)